MTKAVRRSVTKRHVPLGVAAALAALLLVASPVQAHGAPPAREVETRVLLDDDGLLAYGACAGACPPGAGEGLDLLALDVREAAFPDGGPAIVFRMLVQSEAPVPGAVLFMALAAGGVETTLELGTADGLAYTSADFERLDGPFDVGDGHPKAIDAWIRHAALGVGSGDLLSAITVESRRGEERDDVMPGGWYAGGVAVPHLPHGPDPGEALEEFPPGEYALKGPARLVALTADPAAPDLAQGPATVRLSLENVVGLPQFADLALALPDGVSAHLSMPAVSLEGNATREVDLTVSNATAGGMLRVTLVSDLGAYETLDIPIVAPHGHGHAHGNATNTTAAEPGKDAPAAALAAPAALAAALALRRHRHGRREPGGPDL